jgi:hypothetical protein
MTTTINYNDFADFATKMNNSYEYQDIVLDAIKTLHDNYSTFMVTKKYSNEYIKDMRMKSVIDNYEFYKKAKYNNDDMVKYYKNNIVDNFNKKLDPPKCFFTAVAREKRLDVERELFEKETDDIKHHYDSINEKYKFFHELSQKNKDEESDIEDKYYEDTDDDYYSSTDSDYYDIDDYYDYDYESDYMSDEY